MATIDQQQHNSAATLDGSIQTMAYQHGQHPGQNSPPGAPAPPHYPLEKPYAEPQPSATQPTILGMTRRTFWVVLAIDLVLIALVIGLGAGLGAKAARSTDDAASSHRSSAATPKTSVLPTATYTNPASTAPAAMIPCPAQSNTLYTARSATVTTFLVSCGIDYNGFEAVDLASVDTASMEDCMDVCASMFDCEGAGWGSPGRPAAAYTCYLKTNLTSGHSADPLWGFAMNLNATAARAVK